MNVNGRQNIRKIGEVCKKTREYVGRDSQVKIFQKMQCQLEYEQK
jgi:hypothetical protein